MNFKPRDNKFKTRKSMLTIPFITENNLIQARILEHVQDLTNSLQIITVRRKCPICATVFQTSKCPKCGFRENPTSYTGTLGGTFH